MTDRCVYCMVNCWPMSRRVAPCPSWSKRVTERRRRWVLHSLKGTTSFGRRKVAQYVTFALLGSYRFTDRGLLTAGIENIFNEQYLPVYSQLLHNDLNSTRIPANGATLTVAYRHSW